MKEPPTEATLHINTIASPIPTRVYKPATVTPRQTSAMTLSDWNLICLLSTAYSRCHCPSPNNFTREPGFDLQTYYCALCEDHEVVIAPIRIYSTCEYTKRGLVVPSNLAGANRSRDHRADA